MIQPQKTTVDWLRFRTQSTPTTILEAIRPMFGPHASMLHMENIDRGGLHGFVYGAQIVVANMPVGRVDYGGEHQRGWSMVDITGKGCAWITDWDAIDEVQKLDEAEAKRIDVALTTWKGEVSHGLVTHAHKAGRFVTRGRPPAMQQITSSDPRAGRTCYIGKRASSDKFLRCYEKGFQLAAQHGSRLGATITHIDGFAVEDIYRVEAEFKAKNSDIPWDVVSRRDHYFAGAYPFCADILPGVEADTLQRRPERDPQIELEAALNNVFVQYGPTLLTALHAYHGDITGVWEKVVGKEHNKALVEAGVLLVEHS
jgi:DNA relaxase NicK